MDSEPKKLFCPLPVLHVTGVQVRAHLLQGAVDSHMSRTVQEMPCPALRQEGPSSTTLQISARWQFHARVDEQRLYS